MDEHKTKKKISHKRKQYTYICQCCGIEYHPRERDRNKYCSRECAFMQRRIISKQNKPARDKVRKEKQRLATLARHIDIVCKECGETFNGSSDRKYCSEKCREAWAWKAQIRREAKERKCRWCDKAFTPELYDKTYAYCCIEHKGLARKEKKAKRKRERGSGVRMEKRCRVWARDDYVCQLCGKKLKMDELDKLGHSRPHPLTPTVDHIIPASIEKELGYTKTERNRIENLQAAHFICNALRGNKPIEKKNSYNITEARAGSIL